MEDEIRLVEEPKNQMKRYRILSFDFDTRASMLIEDIREEWEDNIKNQHRENNKNTEKSLIYYYYGEHSHEAKLQNFIEFGNKPFSILAFHNRFFEQVRTAFVMGAYYPALTAACALGERILNHLLLVLRNDYKSAPEYKNIYRKNSFDNWDVLIRALESWDILLPEVANQFRCLKDIRDSAIHFRPEVDKKDRELAVKAIRCLNEIIRNQFGALGSHPWFIKSIPGEIYIKKDWETKPFIQKIYLPNCLLVGPKHQIETLKPKVTVNDNFEYDDREITDEEFSDLRKSQGK